MNRTDDGRKATRQSCRPDIAARRIDCVMQGKVLGDDSAPAVGQDRGIIGSLRERQAGDMAGNGKEHETVGMTESGQRYAIERLGEKGLLIRFGLSLDTSTHVSVLELDARLQAEPFPGMIETVPSFAALAVYYDPWQVYRQAGLVRDSLPYDVVCEYVRRLLMVRKAVQQVSTRSVVIPVNYGGEHGPDLEEVAKHHDMKAEEVIRLHAGAEYMVYMIGFMPGFPYMGGLSERIATPRRSTPRLAVPAGSVGIAGAQTGVYPLESPGGWQLIGRTPLRLFRPETESVTLLQAGDRVRFAAISRAEYEALLEAESAAGDEGIGQ
jgi:KipI family sensor histidine kinase inhibitor